MPFDGNVWSDSKLVPYRELHAAIAEKFPGGLVRHQDPAGEVAKNFWVPGHVGSVSFITSMTHAFCGDCNRCAGAHGGCGSSLMHAAAMAAPATSGCPSLLAAARLHASHPLGSVPPPTTTQAAAARRWQLEGLPVWRK